MGRHILRNRQPFVLPTKAPTRDLGKESSMSLSSTQLLEEVRSALHADPQLARRNLHFEHSGRRVTMRGTVESYYQKQLAQETIRRIDGVEEIENRLAVCWPAEPACGLARTA